MCEGLVLQPPREQSAQAVTRQAPLGVLHPPKEQPVLAVPGQTSQEVPHRHGLPWEQPALAVPMQTYSRFS